MVLQSADTNPEVEKRRIALIRRATVAERIARLRSLSATTARLSRRAIARANPDTGERERAVLFVSLHYGRDLANLFRAYLQDAAP